MNADLLRDTRVESNSLIVVWLGVDNKISARLIEIVEGNIVIQLPPDVSVEVGFEFRLMLHGQKRLGTVLKVEEADHGFSLATLETTALGENEAS